MQKTHDIQVLKRHYILALLMKGFLGYGCFIFLLFFFFIYLVSVIVFRITGNMILISVLLYDDSI